MKDMEPRGDAFEPAAPDGFVAVEDEDVLF
jgi:hypothetical protein